MTERIRVFDNGGATIDRYAVVIDGSLYTMSEDPFWPQGVNMYCCELDLSQLNEEVDLAALPEAVRRAIEQRRNDGSQDQDVG